MWVKFISFGFCVEISLCFFSESLIFVVAQAYEFGPVYEVIC